MSTNGDYRKFLQSKAQKITQHGFEPLWMPEWLFDFQKHLVEWAVRMGRAALFCDCGLGKTPMQLVWAENVVRKTNKPVLILTPLAVSYQTEREADKFSINCRRSDGLVSDAAIYATNYERLHYFNADDFGGVVCDESSILKNFDGSTKAAITEFMRKVSYRLLCTATAAPNDYFELGILTTAISFCRRSWKWNRSSSVILNATACSLRCLHAIFENNVKSVVKLFRSDASVRRKRRGTTGRRLYGAISMTRLIFWSG
jgi:hypothetical protein